MPQARAPRRDRRRVGAVPARRRRRRGGGVGRGVFPGPAGGGPVGGDAALLRDGSAALVPVLVGGRGRRGTGRRGSRRGILPLDAGRGQAGAPALAPIEASRCDASRSSRGGRPYAPSVRAHSETVLRGFYDFHLDAGSGPIVNPFPLDRSRRGRPGARAPQPDGAASATSGPGGTGRRCRRRIPRSDPRRGVQRDLRPAALAPGPGAGGVLRLHRRAGVGAAVGHAGRCRSRAAADHGGPQGKPARSQELPASTDAFVWLRLYQVEMDGLTPDGPAAAVVVDAASAVAAVDLSRGAPHVRAGDAAGRQRGDAARAAAHRGLPDGRGPGAAVDRCAVRPRARPADHHADLPDAPQGGRDPPGAGPPRRADPARPPNGRAAPGAGLPAGDAGGAVRERAP